MDQRQVLRLNILELRPVSHFLQCNREWRQKSYLSKHKQICFEKKLFQCQYLICQLSTQLEILNISFHKKTETTPRCALLKVYSSRKQIYSELQACLGLEMLMMMAMMTRMMVMIMMMMMMMMFTRSLLCFEFRLFSRLDRALHDQDDYDDIYIYNGGVSVCHVFAYFAFPLPSWPKLEYRDRNI